MSSFSPPPPAPPLPGCYRHPDQPAGVVCQRCDRPICPSCMHQASVGFHCPECTKRGSQQVYQGVGALVVKPIVTQVLVAANVGVFLLGLVLSGNVGDYLGGSATRFHRELGLADLVCTTGAGTVCTGVGGVAEGEWYRLVTSGFLHFGVIHLAVNMYALWLLGQAVEQYGGRARMGVVYGVSMLTGSLGALVLSPDSLTAGASGAIFGLMGALLLAHRAQGVPFRNSPLISVLAINLVITFGLSGISVGGHLGGLAGGALAGWALFDLARRDGISKQVPWLICGGIALACIVASVVVAGPGLPS